MNNSKTLLEEILNIDLLETGPLESLLATHNLNKLSIKPVKHPLLSKKNKNLQDEIDNLNVIESRKNETYNKVNNERLRLAKRFLTSEDSIMGIKSTQYDKELESLSQKFYNLNKPSYNKLYLVILKGLGVEFVQVGEKKVVKVRNTKTKSIKEVELGEDGVTNKIWEIIE